jgi:MFS superfamily sulfate permease-like transporter
VLGKPEGVSGFHDVMRYPGAHQFPGLLLFRWDAPLFFANAEQFRVAILDAVAAAVTPVRWVIVAAEPVTSVDVTAVDMLTELDSTLHGAGIEFNFAEMKDPVKDQLKRMNAFETLGEHTFFVTVGDAVDAYLAKHPDAR